MSDNLVLQNTAVLSADGAKMNTAVQSGALRLPDLDARPPVRSFRIMPVAAPQKPLQLALKRMIDICGAFFGLLVLSPILLTICALIKLESRGPIFFRQLRTGRNEAPFEIFKFRSMYTDLCDNSGVRQTVSNDPRITRVGRVLRKTNLDELPQLWNVLIGDMSLVGPRPHVPDMLAAGVNYAELVEGYEYRHLMRPGLTGLAQARGLRGPTDHRLTAVRRVFCDVEYVRNFSVLLDIKIMFRTLINELRGGTGF